MDTPLFVFALSFCLLWLAASIGVTFRNPQRISEKKRADFNIIMGATLTLLGLIIGFSFSMATSRYDQRKIYEEAEANAIGTEYVRAGLLPAANTANVRALLRKYLDLRIAFYESREGHQLQQINADTTQLQNQLWSAVQVPVVAQPSPVVALAASGMNDVLNSQGYTQAAWWNRIPLAAWGLMGAIALCGNLLVGYTAQREKARDFLLLVLPLTVSISFLLIADIDSPRGGFVRVNPQNLISLSQSLPAN